MQFPCHGTPQAHAPGAGSMRGTGLLVPMRGTGWFHGGGQPVNAGRVFSAMRERGAVETAARRGYEFSGCNGAARSWVGSCRITSIIPFLIAMPAISARSWPMLRFRISASSLRCPSETAHSTQTKAPPGGGASWVFHACSIGLAVSPGGRNIGKPTTPTPSRAVGCALRGGPQKKPRHGSGAKLVLPRNWAGQGGKRPMQRMPGRFHQVP
jgi:hypothetical protein